MYFDLHVHTMFSEDSEAAMEAYLRIAKQRGVKLLCFTDHVDNNAADYGCGYYRQEAYFAAAARCRELAAAQGIRVLTGMEFGEPHLYQEQLKALSSAAYDMVLGSIHWVGTLFPERKVREQYPAEVYYRLYWNEMWKMVCAGGFDVLAHMDFPKRYYGVLLYEEAELKRIFARMLEQRMVLEINTSSLRKGLREALPDEELLSLYAACGGQYVTIGSDAHSEADLAADTVYAAELAARLGLQPVYFERRELRLLRAEEFAV